ncbi:MAG: hypothetical protein Q9166_002275 [cf. Caloplaca sp. 2 TL-2023]
MSPPTAPCGCNNEYKALLDSHHSDFVARKAQWDKDRDGLMTQIGHLQDTLRMLRAYSSGSQPTSTNALHKAPTRHGSYPGTGHTNLKENTGNQVWLGSGGQPGAVPASRVFSEPFVSTQSPGRLPSIAENIPPSKSGRTFSEQLNLSMSTYKPSVIEPATQKHFDGINFKSAANSSGSRSAQSGRSTDPSSSSRESPKTLQLPPTLEMPNNLTKDAGHTPLPRTNLALDGSAIESDLVTPTQQPEHNRPRLEPLPSTTRPPTERSDSYFPPGADDDPVLKEPLSLKNEGPDSQRFLAEVDSKLHLAAKTLTPPTAVSVSESSVGRYAQEDFGFDQPEDEPKLRIKRSMNFGSQLGGFTIRKR